MYTVFFNRLSTRCLFRCNVGTLYGARFLPNALSKFSRNTTSKLTKII